MGRVGVDRGVLGVGGRGVGGGGVGLGVPATVPPATVTPGAASDPADGVLARLEALRAQAEAATRLRVRREAELDAARAALARAVETLRTEFGVTTVAEAEALLARMQQELVDVLDTMDGHLREVDE